MNDVEQLSHARGQVDGDTLVSKVSRQVPDKLDLFLDREPADNGLEDGADCHFVFPDQTAIIDVGEDTHQESATDVSGAGSVVYQTHWQSIRSVIPPCPGML